MHTVSVLILSHNAAKYIRAALDSALAQTHMPAQILVIDDSTDSSPDIVREYEKRAPGIVQLKRVPPCNVSRARNIALENATGEFISFLDADDIWLPEKTAKQLAKLIESPEAVGAYAHYFDFMNDLDDLQRRVPRTGTDDPDLHDVIFNQHMSSSTILIRRTAIGSLRFDENGPDAEDTLFVAELKLKGRWRLADESLIAKRIHSAQASTSNKHRFRNVKTRLRWLRDRAGAIGLQRAGELHDELARGFMGWLEGLYWRREIDELKRMLPEVREMMPELYAKSFLSRTRLYPRWVYSLRDLFTRRRTVGETTADSADGAD